MIIRAFHLGDSVPSRRYPNTFKSSSRIILGVLLYLSSLLAACAPSSTVQPTHTPPPSRTPLKLGPTSTMSPEPPTAVPSIPTPTLVPIPPISDEDWIRGPDDAAFTFVVYGDFQCPHCAQLASVLTQLTEWHPEDIRTVYRHFPLLSIHDKASLAGQAAEAAGAQGSFWQMYDLLYGQYSDWVELSPDEFLQWISLAAEDLGLDVDQFQNDMASGQYAIQMEEAFYQCIASGILATPFIFLNGFTYQVEPSLTNLESYIRLNQLTTTQYDRYPPMILKEDVQYIAHIELDIGELIIQLYPNYAPLAVNNFIFLAQDGWFNGNPFFTIVPGIYVESGDPTGTGLGGPGYYFADEVSEALTFNEPGMVALSSSGPNTNGSRFFITLAPLPELNNNHTIFGRVIDGLDLLTSLDARQPLDDLLGPPEVLILSVTIEVR